MGFRVKRTTNPAYKGDSPDNIISTEIFKNDCSVSSSSDDLQEMLIYANKIIKLDRAAGVCIPISIVAGIFWHWVFVFTALFIALKIYMRVTGWIDLDYDIESSLMETLKQQMDDIRRISGSKAIWKVLTSSLYRDTKYTAGASYGLTRVKTALKGGDVFPFRSNTEMITLLTSEHIVFLPDMVLIFGKEIAALKYSDIEVSKSTTIFIENSFVPGDTEIVGYTWQYVNRSGGPDKRFKNNRQLPECRYGKITLESPRGLNTVIMFSNPNLI